MVNKWLVPENLDRFKRMLVFRGAGLGRFHCTYCHIHSKTGVSSVGGNKLRFYNKIIDTVHNQETYLSTITNPLLLLIPNSPLNQLS